MRGGWVRASRVGVTCANVRRRGLRRCESRVTLALWDAGRANGCASVAPPVCQSGWGAPVGRSERRCASAGWTSAQTHRRCVSTGPVRSSLPRERGRTAAHADARGILRTRPPPPALPRPCRSPTSTSDTAPLLLAPMEDVTDPPFRLLCKRLGADLVYTEFVSAGGIVHEATSSLQKLDMYDEERPSPSRSSAGARTSCARPCRIVEPARSRTSSTSTSGAPSRRSSATTAARASCATSTRWRRSRPR